MKFPRVRCLTVHSFAPPSMGFACRRLHFSVPGSQVPAQSSVAPEPPQVLRATRGKNDGARFQGPVGHPAEQHQMRG